MPGFAADTSLYKTDEQYHAANHREHSRGIVQAAQFAIRTPFSPSLPTSREEILRAYPYLEPADIDEALRYAASLAEDEFIELPR
jgi:hypothetical protein